MELSELQSIVAAAGLVLIGVSPDVLVFLENVGVRESCQEAFVNEVQDCVAGPGPRATGPSGCSNTGSRNGRTNGLRMS